MSAEVPRFGAVVTAMVTPFDDEGRLDLDGASRLARWLADHGSDGLVVAGTTGEGPVLTDDERRSLVEVVAGAVTVPVIANAGSNDTAHSIEATKAATEAGADAVLVVTPYYNRPSQAGIAAHMAAVAGSTALPVMLYDIPARSGRRIERPTMLGLAREVANIVAVKDAAGDPAGSAHLIAEAPAGFAVYSGDDVLTLPLLAVGAVGVVSVASHWIGETMGEMIAAFTKGDVEGARAANAAMLSSFTFEGSDRWPNPLPVKAVLRHLNLPAGECRLPMGPGGPELDAVAAAIVETTRRGRRDETTGG